MRDFLTVWRSGTALENQETIALVRRFTLNCLREFLKQRGEPEEKWRQIRMKP